MEGKRAPGPENCVDKGPEEEERAPLGTGELRKVGVHTEGVEAIAEG